MATGLLTSSTYEKPKGSGHWVTWNHGSEKPASPQEIQQAQANGGSYQVGTGSFAQPATPAPAPASVAATPAGSGVSVLGGKGALNQVTQKGGASRTQALIQDPYSGSAPLAASADRKDLSAAQGGYEDTLSKLVNPTLGPYVGDATSNPADVARQQGALDQLQGQTGVGETAEEKLLRYMARAKQEQQEKSDRLASQANLSSRGMLGSGGEIASNLGSAQTTGAERTMSELGANANAQQRAMSALQQYVPAAAAAKTANDQIAQFNKGQQTAYQTTKVATDRQNNADTAERAGSVAQGKINLATAKYGTNSDIQNRDTSLTGNVVSNNNNTTSTVNGAASGTSGAVGDQANVKLNADGTLKTAADAQSPGL